MSTRSILSSLTPYLRILRLPGTLAFSASGMIGRAPGATASIGLVLYISASTGSYGLAGQISGGYVLAAALCSPLQARMVDRHGQSRVLPALAGVYGTSLSLILVAVQVGAPAVVPMLLALLAGTTVPMIGAYTRARWSYLLSGTGRLQTAFAFESMADEILFMVGPPIVTLLATSFAPGAGVLAAIVCGVFGTLAFAAQRRTEPPWHPKLRNGPPMKPIGWRALAPVAISGVGIGSLLGATDIVVVALASEQQARAVSGVLLGIWAFGSLLAALIVGAIPPKRPPMARFRWGTVGLALASTPMLFTEHLGLLALFLFVAGFAISPTMIARVSIVEEAAPESRLSEAMVWTSSTMTGGVALGAAVAGQVVDRLGAGSGFVVPALSGALAMLVAWLFRLPGPVRRKDVADQRTAAG